MAAALLLAGCGNHHDSSGSPVNEEAEEGHCHIDCDGHDHESGHGHDADDEDEHSHEANSHTSGVIEFSEERAEAAGLETETVTPGGFSAVIRTSGEILPAQGDEMTVVATTSGVVTLGGRAFGSQASLLAGSKVAKGQAIAVISAREMADGDPVVKSKAAYEAARKEFERAEGLLKVNAISQKAYDQAKKEYETAKAEYDAIGGKASDKGLAVMSPLTGYVKQVLVGEGDYVEAGQPVAIVSQDRRLQLRADLPEKEWARAGSISSANFKPSYSEETYNIRSLGGRMVSVGRAVARGTFYIPVIFEFNNTGHFVPGAFCEVYLITGQKDNVISIPETALTEEQGVYFVYVRIHGAEYRKQEVRIGESDGIRREILKGLDNGDEVVTKGAYQVKLASVSGTIPGHTHNH